VERNPMNTDFAEVDCRPVCSLPSLYVTQRIVLVIFADSR
jgi:hypothetical protein